MNEIAHEQAEARRRADRARWGGLGPAVARAQKILTDPDGYAALDTVVRADGCLTSADGPESRPRTHSIE
ncbi:hypothetical protein [Streptomyces clavuligerus]|uniref:Uncharacterized protein n=1 Tax=Streptomyces clavuligerus TaxID=1901 RepID=B5GLZ3_STRCL|nr:hypothetical protein [Streptomyces clavuligerus]EDY47339.1 hypothetical protein SSCG_00367 [Streptomyces clavuligerus]EFG04997.1 Hypothetical protein SCLAV_p1516 [Streptomyces clavuligerus]MBY6306581.1 hypothetical protein [Streptomyces clavuligerus]QCS10812.1 hypothetical protein CRV15_35470 [Streptomyces clavuligerus]QPJ97151.1 hypothetical protein GE265_29005 [Streptomyces clavuligerus]